MTTQQDSVNVERQIASLRRGIILAALCLSGFAGEGICVEGHDDPADMYRTLVDLIGLPDAEDDDLRAALALPITQRDEQGGKTYADGVEDAAKLAEQWRDENKVAVEQERKHGSKSMVARLDGAAVECNALAIAIRRLSIEQGNQDGGRNADPS